MAITNARAQFGLVATGAPSRTNVYGGVTIGTDNNSTMLAAADVANSVQIVATGANDSVDWDLDTWQATVGSGSPTINDAGVDFEGNTLTATIASYYGILIQTALIDNGSGFGHVNISGSGSDSWIPLVDMEGGESILMMLIPNGQTHGGNTFSAAFVGVEVGAAVTITMLAAD